MREVLWGGGARSRLTVVGGMTSGSPWTMANIQGRDM
jgi:hypothetical protein